MVQIIWHKRASRQFANIQDYLLNEFGEIATKEFTKKVLNFLDLLIKYPELGTLENGGKNIRGFVIHRHTSLFYKAIEDKIYLLSVYDNRQSPKKKKI